MGLKGKAVLKEHKKHGRKCIIKSIGCKLNLLENESSKRQQELSAIITAEPQKNRKTPIYGAFEWWWGKDSNLGRRKPADLQSALVDRLSIPPMRLK